VGPPANGGRIQRRDVEAAIRGQQDAGVSQAAGGAGQAQPAAAQHAAAQHTDERPAQGVVEPISRVRQLIAQRMMEGAHGTAPVTLTTEADATALAELRSHLRTVLEARGRRAPSYNDLLIKLTAVALREHPQLNATWQGETIQRWERIDIGLAVDTADGLLVPVVRDAGRRSVGQIAEVTADLVQRAGARQLTVDELRGGTFTITNLGMYQIDAFTPIINLPQCAILGVGRIQARPAVVDGQVVPRRLVFLSLTFDHRVVDGAPAAREFVEEPALWTMA
jgi:pyruvate dehydrogenase E2 component (dihydrolipoamide acetyltransferase)